MKANLRLFWSGVRAGLSSYMVELTPTLYLGVHTPRTILQALFFVLIAKAAGGNDLARFALVGNAVQIAIFYALLSMEVVIESEKWNSTLGYLIASPSPWLPIMMGKSMFQFFDACLSSALIFLVLPPILGVTLSPLNVLTSAPVILLTIISAGTLGWLIGSLALPIRWGYMICNIFVYVMMVLCGVNFPLSALPPIVRTIGSLVPVTHGLLAVRAIVDGAGYATVLPLIAKETLIALVYGTLAWIAFGWRLRVTRQNGSFELV